MEKLYKIGEIAKLYNISIDTLRYYEDLGLITPKRGSNGYRYYQISHIQRLNTIRDLRAIGFSMEEIKNHLGSRNLDDTLDLLALQINRIDEKLDSLNKLKDRLNTRLNNIVKNKESLKDEGISIKNLTPRKIILFNDEIKKVQDVDMSLKKLQKRHNQANYILSNKSLGAIANVEEIKEYGYGRFESVFYVAPEDSKEYDQILQGGSYITYMHHGAYSNIKTSISKLLDYIKEKQLKTEGKLIEVYIIDEYDSDNVEEFLTELQLKIKE